MQRDRRPRRRASKRDEQAARTTESLLAAAWQFLETHPVSELTLPKLARLAGVTPPTAYTNFGTVEKLLGALYDWLQPRLGTRSPLPPPELLHELPGERFPSFEAHGGLLRSIWASASWSRHRRVSRRPYVLQARDNLRGIVPGIDDRTLLLATGPIMAFGYPPMWQWLRDVIGLSEAEAEEAAAWAIATLVQALVRAPPVSKRGFDREPLRASARPPPPTRGGLPRDPTHEEILEKDKKPRVLGRASRKVEPSLGRGRARGSAEGFPIKASKRRGGKKRRRSRPKTTGRK